MTRRREHSRVSASQPTVRPFRKTLTLLVLAGLSCVAAGAISLPAWADEAQPPPAAAAAPSAEAAAPNPAVAGKSEEELEREAESIARSVMSPFCEGRTI